MEVESAHRELAVKLAGTQARALKAEGKVKAQGNLRAQSNRHWWKYWRLRAHQQRFDLLFRAPRTQAWQQFPP
jgi:hypothetical protein